MENKEKTQDIRGDAAMGGSSFIAAVNISDHGSSMGKSSHHFYKCFPLDQCSLEDGTLREHDATDLSPCSSLIKKVLSEFVGTFVLLFAAAGSAIVNQKTGGSTLGCAAGAGLAVMIIIFSIGHISGAHVNPAVTLSFASLRHFPWIEVPLYIIAQVGGSISGSFTLKGVFQKDILAGGVTVPHGDQWEAFVLEFASSFILMFVITAVATDTRAVGELAGIAVGMTVILNVLISGPSTGGSMNPVRTLGPAIAANNYKGIWVYMVAPILGMQMGAGAYTLIRLKRANPSKLARSFGK